MSRATPGPLFVGGVFENPQTRRLVYVESGFYERDGRISNTWSFRDINPDGTLGRRSSGYGWLEAIPIPVEIEIRVRWKTKTQRRSIAGLVQSYGVQEMSLEDAEKHPVQHGKPKLTELGLNGTTVLPDGKTIVRLLSRFGKTIQFRTELKQTRRSKVTCFGCHKRVLRKEARLSTQTAKHVWFCEGCWDPRLK